MEQILNLQHISYTYHTLEGETPALSDISFSLNKGEFAAIVGPSGCGKSTLLSLICGLLPCSDGQITINGRHLKESTTNVGYMLQHDELFEWRTIYNNVILGLEIQHALTARTKKRAHELLNIYGLSDFENSRPSELSGGMRQRAALIRTLVLEPELLLLDEPFSALDYQTRLQVGDDIGQIIRNEKKSALLVTHDLSEAISLADRGIVAAPAEMVQTWLNAKVEELSEKRETEPQAANVGLTVEIPLDKVAVGNLTKLLDAKGNLIRKALGITDLRIEVLEDRVAFPWFSQVDADSAAAYTHFISALCEMSRNAKRVTATEKPVDNEKYAFRCFLLRLGFIGSEYKAERKILLKNLSGFSAFKNGGAGHAVSE